MIEYGTWREQTAVTLSGAGLRVTLLPEIGAKIVSILDDAGHEYVWQRDDVPYQVPVFGTPFDAWDCSGWDECFPTVAACRLESGPWKGVPVPCHGEVWAVPHQVFEEPGALVTLARGVRFPYTFERRLTLPAAGLLQLDYRVSNESAFDLPYLYSAHPLLKVSPSTRVLLPPAVTQVRVDNTRDHRLGGLGDTLSWPLANTAAGEPTDLSLLTGPACDAGDKLYSQPLPDGGWAGLIDAARGVVAGFRFAAGPLRRIGIWQNQGALLGHFNLALEPCTGYPDRLDLALDRGEASVLPAGEQHRWSMTFAAATGGEPRLRELLGL